MEDRDGVQEPAIPHPQGSSHPPARPRQTSQLCPLAVLSLLCGLVAWILLSMPLSDPPAFSPEAQKVVPLLVVACAVFAVVLGLTAKSRIAKSRGLLSGEGLARTGFWLGALPCVLAIAFLIAFLFAGPRR